MTDKNFYKLQNEWSKIYFREINEADHKKVEFVDRVTGNKSKRILELGAGGGQFAVAAAAARRNHYVTAVEIQPEFTKYIQNLARTLDSKILTIINTDFYTVDFKEPFDVICYWDGFGIGSDSDQQLLLGKVSSWLAPEGSIFLEVYAPWFWANKAAGVRIPIGDAMREYGFDAEKSCMVDTWWLKENPTVKITQHLRCYSPEDLALLLSDSNLEIKEIFPGGYVDYENGTYQPEVPLHRALSYIAWLVYKDTIKVEN
jgi:SAM-dependent methyltransferase